MPRPHLIVGCGIRTDTSNYDGWHEVAVRKFLDLGASAESFEYATKGLLFRWGQDARVKWLGQRIVQLNELGVIPDLVLHSNANEIAVRALDEIKYHLRRPIVRQIHMIAAACKADFDANGLNHAINMGRVRDVFVYGSPDDGALLAAKVSRYITLGLGGYGSLGRSGPSNLRFPSRVAVIMKPGKGHSHFITPPELDATINYIARMTDVTPNPR